MGNLKRFALSVLLFTTLYLTGCQTNLKKEFEEIKLGMDKDQVLEKIGGPQAVTRFHGKDRWFITFYHDSIRYDKEIHFSKGLVNYIGEPYEPPVEKSAVHVDKVNQESDIKTFQELIRSRNSSETAEEDYERKVKGQDKVRFVPNFEPIQ